MRKIVFALITLGAVALSGCASTETAAPSTSTRTAHQTYVETGRPVKVINGKRYVFVPAELGSNMPARWVPEDSPAAQSASTTQSVSRKTIQDLQGGYR